MGKQVALTIVTAAEITFISVNMMGKDRVGLQYLSDLISMTGEATIKYKKNRAVEPYRSADYEKSIRLALWASFAVRV